jgi:hypothetical protein
MAIEAFINGPCCFVSSACSWSFGAMVLICVRNMAGDEVATLDAKPQWTAADVVSNLDQG